MKPFVLGVDPGYAGALALTNGADILLMDMPVITYKGKKEIDGKALAAFIGQYAHKIRFAVVENVGVMKGDGAVSMFRFGRGMGRILGILEAHDIRTVRPEPSVWKPMLGLSANKQDSLAWARQRYPAYAEKFKRKKDVDKAEALALATLGMECFE